jgi:hypothetical protein
MICGLTVLVEPPPLHIFFSPCWPLPVRARDRFAALLSICRGASAPRAGSFADFVFAHRSLAVLS